VWAEGQVDRGAILRFTLHEPPSVTQQALSGLPLT
jgi:hypothetical protein